MGGTIFINYRRGDDPGYTQALYQRLENEFSEDQLFMDIEGHIKPGDDFVEVLNTKVAAADVVLAIIGPRWQDLISARKEDPDDFVAIEIKAALERGKRVIPVLVGGAAVPAPDALPLPIRPLTRRNAIALRPERFKADCQGLVSALKEQLSAASQQRALRTEAERTAAEAERKKREAEEAERIAAIEKRAQAQAATGLSSEEIRKAEELVNWDFIKASVVPQDFRDHLARFPGGVTERMARAGLEKSVWDALGATPDLDQLKGFLTEFPNGKHEAEAKARLDALEKELASAANKTAQERQETEAWARAAGTADPVQIRNFIKEWPNGVHADEAAVLAQHLEWSKVTTGGKVARGVGFYVVAVVLGTLFLAAIGALLG